MSQDPHLVRITPICPNCGWSDPLCWRRNRWVNGVDYSRFEDFTEAYPEFGNMGKGELRSDIHFYYLRGKKASLFVYRWSRFLGPEYYTKSRHYFEHHVPRGHLPKQQSKLNIVIPSTDKEDCRHD